MWTAGSLEKGNKANREANLTHYVNLGLAEMRTSKSAFFFPSDNFIFILEYALLVIRNLGMSYTSQEYKLWIPFSHLYFESRKNIHCVFAAAINILPVWFIAMFNEWVAVVCLSSHIAMQTFSVRQGQSEPCWCLFKKWLLENKCQV